MILSGRIGPGDRLPSEREICATWGVSRITAIRALDDLAQSGLAVRRQGHGTVVAHARVRRSFDTVMGLTEAAARTGLKTRACILERVPVDEADIPASLDPAPGAYVRIGRLRHLGTVPAVLSTLWLAPATAAALSDAELTHGSLHAAFARIAGQEVARSRTTLTPVAAGRSLARTLGVPRGSAHLLFHGITQLADGTIIERTRSVFRGDLFEFSADTRRLPDGGGTRSDDAGATGARDGYA